MKSNRENRIFPLRAVEQHLCDVHDEREFVARECFFVIGQVLAVVHARVAGNEQLHHAGAQTRVETAQYERFVEDGVHGEGVVAGIEGHVVNGAGADNALLGGCDGERYIAQNDSQQTRVRDERHPAQIRLSRLRSNIQLRDKLFFDAGHDECCRLRRSGLQARLVRKWLHHHSREVFEVRFDDLAIFVDGLGNIKRG